MRTQIIKIEIEIEEDSNAIGVCAGFEESFIESLTKEEEKSIKEHVKEVAYIIEKSIKRQIKEDMDEIKDILNGNNIKSEIDFLKHIQQKIQKILDMAE